MEEGSLNSKITMAKLIGKTVKVYYIRDKKTGKFLAGRGHYRQWKEDGYPFKSKATLKASYAQSGRTKDNRQDHEIVEFDRFEVEKTAYPL